MNHATVNKILIANLIIVIPLTTNVNQHAYNHSHQALLMLMDVIARQLLIAHQTFVLTMFVIHLVREVALTMKDVPALFQLNASQVSAQHLTCASLLVLNHKLLHTLLAVTVNKAQIASHRVVITINVNQVALQHNHQALLMLMDVIANKMQTVAQLIANLMFATLTVLAVDPMQKAAIARLVLNALLLTAQHQINANLHAIQHSQLDLHITMTAIARVVQIVHLITALGTNASLFALRHQLKVNIPMDVSVHQTANVHQITVVPLMHVLHLAQRIKQVVFSQTDVGVNKRMSVNHYTVLKIHANHHAAFSILEVIILMDASAPIILNVLQPPATQELNHANLVATLLQYKACFQMDVLAQLAQNVHQASVAQALYASLLAMQTTKTIHIQMDVTAHLQVNVIPKTV